MKNSTLYKKLAGYSAGATGIFAMHASNAQIIYTNIPDIILKTDDTYCLDLNNDGTCDYHIDMRQVAGIVLDEITQSCPATGGCNQVVAYSNDESHAEPVNVPRGEKIGPAIGWFTPDPGDYFDLGIYSSAAFTGEWAGGVKNGFLGVRFYVGTYRYYGWVRIAVNKNGTKLIVKDYAYEASGKTILAGDNGMLGKILPETKGNTAINKITIYPSPANQFVLFDGVKNFPAENEMIIYDLQGKIAKVISPSEYAQRRIDVSSLNDGIYALRVRDLNGMQIAKFLVQH